jgi:hypothetical protein
MGVLKEQAAAMCPQQGSYQNCFIGAVITLAAITDLTKQGLEKMADEPQTATEVVPTSGDTPISLRDAANSVADYRYKRDAKDEPAAAPAEAAAPQDSSQEENAAPPKEATGETAETTDQPDTAPLGLPRSWAKDKQESWDKLDRDTQQYLLDHDSKSTTEVRRTQNEAAEQRKAIEAERSQLEQARKQYEEALPMLLTTLQQQQQGEFGDIRTMADVEKLAREDWPRYALWDAQQKKLAAVSQEMQSNQQRQAQEFTSQWLKFDAEQSAKFIELHPELTDKAKLKAVGDEAVQMLEDRYGFTRSDIAALREGKQSLAGLDARFQSLVYDALRFHKAQAALKKAAPKPVPQVQRPGVAPVRGEDRDIRVSNLEKQLERSGSWKDAAELLVARRSRG